MKFKNGAELTRTKYRARRLPDFHGTGYGWGYGGGDRLYAVCLVDCFDPLTYLIRADCFSDAYECAEETLCADFSQWATADELAQYEAIGDAFNVDSGIDNEAANICLETFMSDHWLAYSSSGRVISAEDDIRVWQLSGPCER